MSEPIFVLRDSNGGVPEDLRKHRDVSVLTNWIFWNLWSRRVFPYKSIEEGQTLYFVDTKAREIGVELRVSGIGRVHYDDPVQPYRTLERVFGIGSEFAESAIHRRDLPVPGYLLAVAVDPVAYIGTPIELDWSKVGGRAGWAAWSTVLASKHTPQPARDVLLGLPPEGRPVATRSYPIDTGAITGLPDLPRAPRNPSPVVIRQVSERAGGRCEAEGCDAAAEHLDHIYPWAHGGNSDLANLQWLCARHNLKKSDQIPEHFTADQLWLRYVTELDDETVAIGDDLSGHEIRTRNSIYDLVVDRDLMYLWKRGAREVYVEAFDGMEALIVDHKNGQRIEVPGNPDLDGPLFSSSPVASIKEADPVAALARLARKPGDAIALSPLGEG